jgi:peptidoglycan/xylan/chitin deacetylase (PgdA/CDA1 family)
MPVPFRPTLTLWCIVAAPFLTLGMLAAGWLEALWFLFFSHLTVIWITVVPLAPGFGPVFKRFETSEPAVWLTIDDGPDPETTPALLAALREDQARATFFLVGEQMLKHPDLVNDILREGHQIGNHTQSHPRFAFWRLGPRRLQQEIERFEASSAAIAGTIPLYFRAPTGMKNPFVHPILSARQLMLIGWSARAFDTRSECADQVMGRLRPALQPGVIILLHERTAVGVEALRRLLKELRLRGLRCVLPAPGQLRT